MQNVSSQAQQLQPGSTPTGPVQQVMLCPVRIVYDAQMLLPPGGQYQPNQPVLIRPTQSYMQWNSQNYPLPQGQPMFLQTVQDQANYLQNNSIAPQERHPIIYNQNSLQPINIPPSKTFPPRSESQNPLAPLQSPPTNTVFLQNAANVKQQVIYRQNGQIQNNVTLPIQQSEQNTQMKQGNLNTINAMPQQLNNNSVMYQIPRFYHPSTVSTVPARQLNPVMTKSPVDPEIHFNHANPNPFSFQQIYNAQNLRPLNEQIWTQSNQSQSTQLQTASNCNYNITAFNQNQLNQQFVNNTQQIPTTYFDVNTSSVSTAKRKMNTNEIKQVTNKKLRKADEKLNYNQTTQQYVRIQIPNVNSNILNASVPATSQSKQVLNANEIPKEVRNYIFQKTNNTHNENQALEQLVYNQQIQSVNSPIQTTSAHRTVGQKTNLNEKKDEVPNKMVTTNVDISINRMQNVNHNLNISNPPNANISTNEIGTNTSSDLYEQTDFRKSISSTSIKTSGNQSHFNVNNLVLPQGKSILLAPVQGTLQYNQVLNKDHTCGCETDMQGDCSLASMTKANVEPENVAKILQNDNGNKNETKLLRKNGDIGLPGLIKANLEQEVPQRKCVFLQARCRNKDINEAASKIDTQMVLEDNHLTKDDKPSRKSELETSKNNEEKSKYSMLIEALTGQDIIEAKYDKGKLFKKHETQDIVNRVTYMEHPNKDFKVGDNEKPNYLLTHVLEGIVVQESNVAFPIRPSIKENKHIKSKLEEREAKNIKSKEVKDDIEEEKVKANKVNDYTEYWAEFANEDNIEKNQEKGIKLINVDPKEVKSWTVDALSGWLVANGWSACAKVLRNQEIDGTALTLATPSQLRAAGVRDALHVLEALQAQIHALPSSQ